MSFAICLLHYLYFAGRRELKILLEIAETLEKHLKLLNIYNRYLIPFSRQGEKVSFSWMVEAISCLFVAASPQTRLDTWSKARRPIKVGIKGAEGRERAETRTLLVYAAYRLTWCNVSLMRQAVSRSQMWVQARMPGYGLN